MAEINTYVDPDADGGGTGVDWDNAYEFWTDWVVAEGTDLESDGDYHIANFRSSEGTVDTGGHEDIDDWNTAAANYIEMYCAPEDRHNGAWDVSAWRATVANAALIDVEEYYVRITGLQLEVTAQGASGESPLAYSSILGGATCDFRISYCLIRGGVSTGSWYYTVSLYDADIDGAVYIWNNVIAHRGFDDTSDMCLGLYLAVGCDCYVYSNTLVREGDFDRDLVKATQGDITLKNNVLVKGATGNTVSGSVNGNSDYNCTDATAATGGANDETEQTFTFVGAGSFDYHLHADDVGATGEGVDTSGEGAPLDFSDDIDGDARTGTWDCGADQKVAVGGISMPLVMLQMDHFNGGPIL